ncbi:MAG: hypothetical protein WAX33_04330 [Rectinemataceae bacterium]
MEKAHGEAGAEDLFGNTHSLAQGVGPWSAWEAVKLGCSTVFRPGCASNTNAGAGAMPGAVGA